MVSLISLKWLWPTSCFKRSISREPWKSVSHTLIFCTYGMNTNSNQHPPLEVWFTRVVTKISLENIWETFWGMYVDLNVAHSFRKLADSKNKGSTVFQRHFSTECFWSFFWCSTSLSQLILKKTKKNYLSFMFHNHFAVHGKWTTWQDISNCRIRKDWKRSCSSHAILWCDGKRTWRFEVRVLYRVLLWEAVWPNGCTSSWYRVIILNSIFLFLFLSFFFLVFIFRTFKVIRMNLVIISVIGPADR